MVFFSFFVAGPFKSAKTHHILPKRTGLNPGNRTFFKQGDNRGAQVHWKSSRLTFWGVLWCE